MDNQDNKQDNFSIPTVSDENVSNAGEIRINHSVIANIVRLSALEVSGVLDIATQKIADGLLKFFAKDGDHGIKVTEDEAGSYVIDVPVVLSFGCELAKVAMEIQQNVARQVARMTMKEVARVNVIIDAVRIAHNAEKTPTINTDYARN